MEEIGNAQNQNIKLLVSQNNQLEILVQMNQEIKSTAYGKLYKGVNKNNPSQYFYVKMIYSGDKEYQAMLRNELEMSKLLSDSSTILLYLPYIYTSKQHCYLISEFWEKTLKQQMEEKEYSEEQIIKIFMQLVAGYKALFDSKILHQNISPSHIYVNNGVYKIGGFEHAVFYEKHTFDQSKYGDLRYMAPEKMVMKVYQGNPKSDVYSLGIVLYEIIAKRHPYLPKQGEIEANIDVKESRRALIDMLKQKEPDNLKSNQKSLEFNNIVSMVMKMISKSEPKRVSFEDLWEFVCINKYFSVVLPEKSLSSSFTSMQSFKQIKDKRMQSAFYCSQIQRKESNDKIYSYLLQNRKTVAVLSNLYKSLVDTESQQQKKKRSITTIKLLMFAKYLNQEAINQMQNPQKFSEQKWLLFNDSEQKSIIKLMIEDKFFIQQLIKEYSNAQNQLEIQAIETFFKNQIRVYEKQLVLFESIQNLLNQKCILINPEFKKDLILILHLMMIEKFIRPWGEKNKIDTLSLTTAGLENETNDYLLEKIIEECLGSQRHFVVDEGRL